MLFENKPVPLQSLLALGLSTGKLTLAELEASHQNDRNYLGWLQTRLAGIPLDPSHPENRFTCRTGVEGYYYASVDSPEQLAAEIMLLGKNIWSGINILHKGSYQKRRSLRNTIMGIECDLDSAVEWSTIFAATLARLRAKLLYNPEAQRFQAANKQRTESLPMIEYAANEGETQLVQTYKLPIKNLNTTVISGIAKTEEELLYWETVQNLGVFGHPIPRQLFKELY